MCVEGAIDDTNISYDILLKIVLPLICSVILMSGQP